MAVSFSEAYEAAVSRYTHGMWGQLTPRQQIDAIYQEMSRLDTQAVKTKDDAAAIEVAKLRLSG